MLTIALPLEVRPPLRQAPCFELVHHAVGCEEQQLRVGIGHEKGGDHVLFFGLHASDTPLPPRFWRGNRPSGVRLM